MTTGNVRLRGAGFFILLGGISFFGTAVPLACNQGSALAPAEAGATGANGGTPANAAATGGADGQVGNAPGLDVPADASVGDSPAAGGGGTGGSGGAGGAVGEGGMGGGRMIDGGPLDVAQTDGAGTDQGGAGGGDGGDGAAGRDGAVTDGGSVDVMFSCGPCGINWACGGATGTPYTYVTLVPEEDGCYLSGLPGHKLLAPDGTITENGVNVARAQKFGPQVGLYYPDGSQWLYCGGVLPCATQ